MRVGALLVAGLLAGCQLAPTYDYALHERLAVMRADALEAQGACGGQRWTQTQLHDRLTHPASIAEQQALWRPAGHALADGISKLVVIAATAESIAPHNATICADILGEFLTASGALLRAVAQLGDGS